MALTQEQQVQINQNWHAAFDKFNGMVAEKVVFSNATRDRVVKYLNSQQIPPTEWVEQVFIVALTEVYGDLEKVVVKTREEIERERTRANQAGSKQRYRKDGDNKPATLTDIASPLQSITDMLTGKRAEKSEAAKPAVVWPSLEADYEQLPADQQKLYRALSPADMRKWLAKRAEIVRNERAAAAGVNTNNLKLQGE
jgi:hypothetical protein